MFEFDDDDNTIMHQWKSHEEENGVASKPSANQLDNLSEYQKVWEQFHTTFLQDNQDLKSVLSIPDVRKQIKEICEELDKYEDGICLRMTNKPWTHLIQSSRMGIHHKRNSMPVKLA